jgi:hypothetical protein
VPAARFRPRCCPKRPRALPRGLCRGKAGGQRWPRLRREPLVVRPTSLETSNRPGVRPRVVRRAARARRPRAASDNHPALRSRSGRRATRTRRRPEVDRGYGLHLGTIGQRVHESETNRPPRASRRALRSPRVLPHRCHRAVLDHSRRSCRSPKRFVCRHFGEADAGTRTPDPFITSMAWDLQSLALGREKPVLAGPDRPRATE